MICDKCGKPIIANVDARYTVADSPDGKTGRHYACHTPVESLLGDLRSDLRRIDRTMTGLRAQTEARNFVGTGRFRK